MALTKRAGEDRLLTVPNAVTLARLAAIPAFVVLLAEPHRRGWYAAAWLLGVLGATDGVDGFVARRFDQVSTLGKVLDPVADRLLLAVAGISIVALGAVPLWVAVAALAREALVAVGFLYVAAAGGRRMDVSRAGKAGTFGLMVALPLFLAGHAHDSWKSLAETLAWVAAIPGLAFGWYSAFAYLPRAKAVIEQARRAEPDGGDDKEAKRR
jgi:cardiolipin synthase